MEFELREEPVASPTTGVVRDRLAGGTGCVVVGRPGTGKTYAVREAVNGAAWINLRDDELQFDQFFTDLAAQVPGGRRIVDALGAHDQPAVLERAAAELDNVTLVVDRAERLRFDEVWGWDEPVEALWRPAQVVLARWIGDQTSHRRVVVIGRGRRGFFAEQARVHHQIPTGWSVKLVRSSRGFRDWAALGNAVGGAPAGLWIGALLRELTTKDEFNELVESFDPKEDSPDQVVRDLLGALRDRLPDEWRRVFATVQALDGAPAEIVETVLKPGERSTLSYLERLAAIERRRGRLSLMPALTLGEPVATLWPLEHREVLGAAAKEYLERVPDVTRPDGASAEFIVRAHGIYVELGGFRERAPNCPVSCRRARAARAPRKPERSRRGGASPVRVDRASRQPRFAALVVCRALRVHERLLGGGAVP